MKACTSNIFKYIFGVAKEIFYAINVYNKLFFAGPKELLHLVVVIRTPLPMRWNGMRITYVTNVRRLIMVVRRVATHN